MFGFQILFHAIDPLRHASVGPTLAEARENHLDCASPERQLKGVNKYDFCFNC
jgi:hypothetical protein